MKKLILLVLCLLTSLICIAQEFAIKTVEITPEQVVLHYDLVDTAKHRTYTVFVYSSHDNFLAPLTRVSGDEGMEVKPGLNRKIAWNAKEELGETFDGEVELEIRGRMYIPFIRFEGFEDVEVRKRKSPFIVKWSGGTRQNILNFQLYQKSTQGDKLAHTFPNAPNEFEYKLELPNTVKPGKDYYFRISDTKNKDQVVITPTFVIKRKIPLALQALPLVIIGATYPIWIKWFRDDNKELDPAPGPPE